MLFKCNYNVKDLQITSTFYLELLKWWSALRLGKIMLLIRHWHYVIWNNRDLRKDDKPFFYKEILRHWYLRNRRLTFLSQQYGTNPTNRSQKMLKRQTSLNGLL